MLREEFLRLLREDVTFREEVRRQLLTDALLALPERVEQLRKEMHEEFRKVWETLERVGEQIAALTEQMRSHTEALGRHGQTVGALIPDRARELQNGFPSGVFVY